MCKARREARRVGQYTEMDMRHVERERERERESWMSERERRAIEMDVSR